jgi:CheY-like chemotaxis protein
MEDARIVLFEDHETIRRYMCRSITRLGHAVVREAASWEESLPLVEQLQEDEFDVAVIDGNMGSGRSGTADGSDIAYLIADRFPEKMIIGHSASGAVPGTELQIPKGNASALVEIIEAL